MTTLASILERTRQPDPDNLEQMAGSTPAYVDLNDTGGLTQAVSTTRCSRERPRSPRRRLDRRWSRS